MAGPRIVPKQTYALPPIFWKEDDEDAPAPTLEAIELVTVQRVTRGGDCETIDTVQPQSLPDTNALRERYGAGLFKVIGRSRLGTIVARATHTIGLQSTATATASATPEPAAAAAGGGSMDRLITVLLTQMTGMMQQNTALTTALAKMGMEGGSQVTAVVAELSKARLVDQSDMFQTLLKAKGSGGGAADFKAGMDEMLKLLEAAKGGDDDGSVGDADTRKIEAFVKGIEAVGRLQNNRNGSPANSPTQ